MQCEFCHNVPQIPPCRACGGSGIEHCCDGPVGGPDDIANSGGPKIPLCPHCGSVVSAVTFECVRGERCPGPNAGANDFDECEFCEDFDECLACGVCLDDPS